MAYKGEDVVRGTCVSPLVHGGARQIGYRLLSEMKSVFDMMCCILNLFISKAYFVCVFRVSILCIMHSFLILLFTS